LGGVAAGQLGSRALGIHVLDVHDRTTGLLGPADQ
jgi:hypothetical protein